MSFVPHGWVHAHASSSRRAELAMDADKKHAPANPSCSEGTGFWHDPQSGTAECAFCHHRAFSRVSAHLDFWKTIHAKYCPKRANQARGRVSVAPSSI